MLYRYLSTIRNLTFRVKTFSAISSLFMLSVLLLVLGCPSVRYETAVKGWRYQHLFPSIGSRFRRHAAPQSLQTVRFLSLWFPVLSSFSDTAFISVSCCHPFTFALVGVEQIMYCFKLWIVSVYEGVCKVCRSPAHDELRLSAMTAVICLLQNGGPKLWNKHNRSIDVKNGFSSHA